MPTQCSARAFEFARVESRAVVAAFDGGAVKSDGGVCCWVLRIARCE